MSVAFTVTSGLYTAQSYNIGIMTLNSGYGFVDSSVTGGAAAGSVSPTSSSVFTPVVCTGSNTDTSGNASQLVLCFLGDVRSHISAVDIGLADGSHYSIGFGGSFSGTYTYFTTASGLGLTFTALNRPVSITITDIVGNFVTLTISVSKSVSMALLRQKILAYVSTCTVSFIRQLPGIVLSYTVSYYYTLKRTQYRTLTLAVTSTVAAVKQLQRVISRAVTSAVSRLNQIQRQMAVGCSAAVSLARQVGRVLTAVCVTAPTLVRQLGRLMLVQATCAPAALKGYFRTLSRAVTSLPAATEIRGKLLQVVAACAVRLTFLVTGILHETDYVIVPFRSSRAPMRERGVYVVIPLRPAVLTWPKRTT